MAELPIDRYAEWLRELADGEQEWSTPQLRASAAEFEGALLSRPKSVEDFADFDRQLGAAKDKFVETVNDLASESANTKVFQCYDDYRQCRAQGESSLVCASLLAYCLARLK